VCTGCAVGEPTEAARRVGSFTTPPYVNAVGAVLAHRADVSPPAGGRRLPSGMNELGLKGRACGRRAGLFLLEARVVAGDAHRI
jgi:hypothetical protein